MKLIIKKKENPDIDLLISLKKKFNFEINMSNYKTILVVYDNKVDKNIISFINYRIIPSMAGRDRLYIKNLCYLENQNIDNIIKLICKYCETNNLAIKIDICPGKYNDECIKAFYDNNFKGTNTLYYIY